MLVYHLDGFYVGIENLFRNKSGGRLRQVEEGKKPWMESV